MRAPDLPGSHAVIGERWGRKGWDFLNQFLGGPFFCIATLQPCYTPEFFPSFAVVDPSRLASTQRSDGGVLIVGE
jgi:hypothetical protein